MRTWTGAGLIVAVAVGATAPAHAGVAAWRLEEVLVAGDGGDATVRFVEAYAADDGCWFPTTQLVVLDGAGAVLDVAAPFAETTCFTGETYLLFATAGAEAAYGVTADRAAVPAMPAAARQVCLRSTTTVYDCVRWDGVTVAVRDLLGPDDDSTAPAPPPGYALARTAESHVVADDWIVATPTPRAPNDGTPWDPPDGGVPDAGPPDGGPPDGGAPDAGPRPDAPTPPVDAAPPDARDDRFLDLDAQGGAGCGCRAGGAPGPAAVALLVLALTAARRRTACRRRAGPPGSGRAWGRAACRSPR